MVNLESKTVLITGGGQGIGRGIALAMASAGADVVVTHLPTPNDSAQAEGVAGDVRALGHRSFAVPLNVTDAQSIHSALAGLFDRISGIDILVNNAGVMQRSAGLNTTDEDFDLCHAVNVKGVWNVTHAVLPHFKDRGVGCVINISSGAGRRGSPDLPAYSASKAAVISITQSLALALGPYNVNVNCVCPGIVWTPMCEQFAGLFDPSAGQDPRQTLEEIWRPTIPLRRLQTAEDVGHAVVFLASSGAKNITGQSLNVDGGLVMS